LKEKEQNILFSYCLKYFQVGQLLTGIPSKPRGLKQTSELQDVIQNAEGNYCAIT